MSVLPTERSRFAQDLVVATVAVVVLYGLMRVPVPFVRIPGYLLVVGFDWLEFAFGSAGGYYYPFFAAYLLGVGAAGAVIAHLFRTLTARTDISEWRFGVAGACTVIGCVSLAFALFVSTRVNTVSVLLTGGVAVVLFGVAWSLLGTVDIDVRVSR